MQFLVPLYLLGALALAVPIYLHLRRRPPNERVEFSSLMFLQPTPHEPLKRRSRLENLPLLLLRCLALLCLAALFARPFFPGGDQELEEGRARTVLLLDTSASMQRTGLWDAARSEALAVVDAIGPDDLLAVVAVDRRPRVLVDFDDWAGEAGPRRAATARRAIEALEPGWQGSDLGAGLLAAAELVSDAAAGEEAPRAARLVLVSDLQRGADLDAVTGASWPTGLAVELRPVEPESTTNASLGPAAGSDPQRPRVRVRNDPASEVERFELRAGDERIPVVVPAGESRVIELPGAVDEVVLSGDGSGYDNRLFLAPREPAPVTLAFLGEGTADDPDLPEYYFRRAFGESKLLAPRFVDELSDRPDILAVARPLGEAESGAVRRQLEDGGRVLLVVTSTAMADTLAALAGADGPVGLREAGGRYALLEGIDFDHPLLGGFQDPRWRDFTEVRFWRHRVLDPAELPGARVIAGFDDGSPAWLEIAVGEGQLVVMLAGWHPRDSQLALSPKFLPLLYSIFADRGLEAGEARRWFVGDALPVDAGAEIEAPAEAVVAGDPPRAEMPGHYRWREGGRERRIAVNLRPSESDLQALAEPALTALGVPLGAAAGAAEPEGASGKRRLRAREAEANDPLWRWAALILLALLIVESWAAARRDAADPHPVTP